MFPSTILGEIPPSFGNEIVVRLLVLTGLLIAVCVAVYCLSRRTERQKCNGSHQQTVLQVIESLALNSRETIHLIRVGIHRIAVAHDRRGITRCCIVPESFELPTPKSSTQS